MWFFLYEDYILSAFMDLSKNSKILDITTINMTKPPRKTKQNKTVTTEKPKTKRVITTSERWPTDLDPINIGNALNNTMISNTIMDADNVSQDLLCQQVRQKISGYRGQDVEKRILDIEKLITLQDVLDLFKTSELLCYYCREPVLLLYEFVREPKQWTLERLDNSQGHNRDNVVLACLHCNLRRRCMASERYVQTKQMTKIVKMG